MSAMVIDVHGCISRATPPARLNTYARLCGIHTVFAANRDAASAPAGAGDVDEVDANLTCLQACEAHPHLTPVYWVRPGRPDSNALAFAGALETAPFIGALFSPVENDFEADDKLLEPYLVALAHLNCPALFCYTDDERSAPSRVYEQARRHPEVTFVLCAGETSTEQRAAAREVVRQAVEREDADLLLNTAHSTEREITIAVRTVGPERVLFGTNAPAYGDSHVPRHIALLDELRRDLPQANFQQVASANAARVFGLWGKKVQKP